MNAKQSKPCEKIGGSMNMYETAEKVWMMIKGRAPKAQRDEEKEKREKEFDREPYKNIAEKEKEKHFRVVPCAMCDSQHTNVHGPLTRTRPRHESKKLRVTQQ